MCLKEPFKTLKNALFNENHLLGCVLNLVETKKAKLITQEVKWLPGLEFGDQDRCCLKVHTCK